MQFAPALLRARLSRAPFDVKVHAGEARCSLRKSACIQVNKLSPEGGGESSFEVSDPSLPWPIAPFSQESLRER